MHYMRVYNLTTAQFGISNLVFERLKIARFSELNDPFELLAVDVANQDLRTGISAKKSQTDSEQGLVCFSRNWRNPLLWSHYADKHHGICLGFDVPSRHLRPVRYVKGMRRINVISPKTTQQTIDRFLERLKRTKFHDLKYEDEVRYFVDLKQLTPYSGIYFLEFSPDLLLREVILGSRCDLPINAIKKLTGKFSQTVNVIRSKIAFREFSVVKNR